MKLTLKEIVRIYGGLAGTNLHHGLNGYWRVIESEGKASDKVFVPFGFPQQTKVNIVRNIQILKPLNEIYVEQRREVLKTLSPDGTGAAIDASPKLAKEFTEKVEELEKTTQDVKGLLSIPWETLEVAKVSAVVISDLGRLVRGMPKPDDADLVPEE